MAQGELEVKVARIEILVQDLHHQLLGNGQPGAIQKLESKASSTEERLRSLENSRSWIKGSTAAIWGVITFVGGAGILKLFKG